MNTDDIGAVHYKRSDTIRLAYEVLSKAGNVFFFAMDKHYALLYANELFLKHTGIQTRVGEVLDLDKLFPPYNARRLKELVMPAVMRGESVGGDVVLLAADGVGTPLRYSSFPVRDENGEIFAYASVGMDISAEVAIRATAELQRSILNSSADMVLSLDDKMNIVYANPALEEAIGRPLMGEDVQAILRSDEKNFMQIALNAKNEKTRVEMTMLKHSGESIPVEANVFPLYDPMSNLTRIGISIRDIIDKQAIRNSNEQLELALKMAKAGVWETDFKTQLVHFDRGTAEIMRFKEASPIKLQTWHEYMKQYMGDNYDDFIAFVRGNYHVNEEVDYQNLRMDLPDGTFIYANCNAKIYCNKAGDPLRIVGVIRDVTHDYLERFGYEKMQRKQLETQEFIANFSHPFTRPMPFEKLMEDALTQLQNYLKTDRICVHSTIDEGELLHCAYEKVREDRLGSVCGNVRRIDELTYLIEGLNNHQYLYFPDTQKLYARYPNIDYGAKSALYIVMTVDAEIVGYLVFQTADHHAHWTQNDLQLAQMAASIIAGALVTRNSQQKLREATAEAQKASNAKSRFLSNMSHEMRTPMNAIIGMTQLADETNDINVLKNYLSAIKTSSHQLVSIINDVLDISKIESGKLMLNKVPFAVGRAVMQALSLVLNTIEDKQQHIYVTGASHLSARYIGDDVRIAQVLTNLLSNAAKFTPEGGEITLDIDEIASDDEHATIRAVVTDNGIGMTREQASRIFHSFEQADSSVSRNYGGTGLGLAICKNLLEQMNGGISVESEVGQGSKFTIHFTVDQAPEQAEKALQRRKRRYGALRILLVAESEDVRKRFETLQTDVGFTLEYATCGMCLNRIRRAMRHEKPYNIVFLEAGLPLETTMLGPDDGIDHQTLVMVTRSPVWRTAKHIAERYGITWHIAMPLLPPQFSDVLTQVMRATGVVIENSSQNLDFSAIRLLVAEDIEINRMIIGAMLDDTGVAIDYAENGLVAVEKMKADPKGYDMILMDVQMPRMDGMDATRAIRALPDPAAKEIPIVALTANAFREDADMCIAAGMNGHLGKPVDKKALINMVAQYTHRNST